MYIEWGTRRGRGNKTELPWSCEVADGCILYVLVSKDKRYQTKTNLEQMKDGKRERERKV